MRLTLELEGEVVGQVAALVVASEEEHRLRVVDLERPQVENTLRKKDRRVSLGFGSDLPGRRTNLDAEVTAICEQAIRASALAATTSSHRQLEMWTNRRSLQELYD